MPQFILILIIIALAIEAIKIIAIPLLIVLLCWLAWYLLLEIVQAFYFLSENFLNIKESIKENAKKCNELNSHIEELKMVYINIKSTENGNANYYDNDSAYHFKRSKINQLNNNNYIHHCSLSVCKNAKLQPFKYFCKYFNVKVNEKTLSDFEEVFNQFSAVEQGKRLLIKEREALLENLRDKIPYLIFKFRKNNLIKELGFADVVMNTDYFPKYSFIYTSAGGNSSMKCDIIFSIANLEKFIKYLSDIVKFKKSVQGQRALMTSSLREKIKERDNYTCRICGLSTEDEHNLLLEIDHIIPVSKGGITSEDNLQTLCWKCNRSKSNKLIED